MLKGSILEPLVAIMILLIVMGMSLAILTRNNTAIQVKAVNKANEIINSEIIQSLLNDDYLDKEVQYGGFLLVKETAYNEESKLVLLNLKVYDSSNKLIAYRKHSFPMFMSKQLKQSK